MIRQRTKEGLRLRMKMGVLCGRPPGRASNDEALKYYAWKERITQMYEWKMTGRQIANVVGCDRNTLYRLISRWGLKGGRLSADWVKEQEKRNKEVRYKDTAYRRVDLPRAYVMELINKDLTLPQIAEMFPAYTYEQVYDTFMCDYEYNTEYRKHGMLKCKSARKRSLHS